MAKNENYKFRNLSKLSNEDFVCVWVYARSCAWSKMKISKSRKIGRRKICIDIKMQQNIVIDGKWLTVSMHKQHIFFFSRCRHALDPLVGSFMNKFSLVKSYTRQSPIQFWFIKKGEKKIYKIERKSKRILFNRVCVSVIWVEFAKRKEQKTKKKKQQTQKRTCREIVSDKTAIWYSLIQFVLFSFFILHFTFTLSFFFFLPWIRIRNVCTRGSFRHYLAYSVQTNVSFEIHVQVLCDFFTFIRYRFDLMGSFDATPKKRPLKITLNACNANGNQWWMKER